MNHPDSRYDESPAHVGLRITVYSEVDGTTTDLLFQQFPIRIGRNPLNELVLAHQYISQWHAVIGFSGGALSIIQVGSSNSVMVNDYRMQASEEIGLAGNEVVRLVPFSLHLQVLELPGAYSARQGSWRNESFGTRDASVSMSVPQQESAEQVALRVIDRLSQRLVGQPMQDPRQIAVFGRQLERVLEVFLRCFVALQKGQEQFKAALDLPALGDEQVGLIDQARDGVELGALLLSGQAPNAANALEQAFKDIMVHQVALLNGLMAGVRTLLARISPQAVHKEASKERRSPNWRLLFETYEQMHQDLSEEGNEAFETIFGRQFGKAYTMLVGKKKGGGGA
ncbi:MAG: FHA domain-containing protein [Myxococcales bacterium]|nr:FHA domain-containing protein [Myxococcales bacterium]